MDRVTDDELDRGYSALCTSLAELGPERSELLLSMLCLSLMARSDSLDPVLALIANAQAQCRS